MITAPRCGLLIIVYRCDRRHHRRIRRGRDAFDVGRRRRCRPEEGPSLPRSRHCDAAAGSSASAVRGGRDGS